MEVKKFKPASKEEEEVKQVVSKKESNYELVQVPTQHSLAVQTPEGEVMSIEQATVEILNHLVKLRRDIAG